MQTSSRRLDVPFVKDVRKASCQGPACAMIALLFFKPESGVEMKTFFREMGYRKGQWFFETYIVRGLGKHGIRAEYLTTKLPEKIRRDSAKLRRVIGIGFEDPSAKDELDVKSYDSAIEEGEKSGKIRKVSGLGREAICGFLKKGALVIATVNRNELTGESSEYKGHFTLITGFDSKGYFLNDPYLGAGIKVSFKRFERAFFYPEREGKGITTDAVIVHGLEKGKN